MRDMHASVKYELSYTVLFSYLIKFCSIHFKFLSKVAHNITLFLLNSIM